MVAPIKIDWTEARALYEGGESMRSVARTMGVSHEAVRRRVDLEGWAQDQERTIRRKAAAKASGLANVDSGNNAALAAAVEEEAERRAAIVRVHRDEPKVVRGLMYDAAKAVREARTTAETKAAELKVRAVKGLAQTMRDLHAMERDAWGLELLPEGAPGAMAAAGFQVVIQYGEEPGAITYEQDD